MEGGGSRILMEGGGSQIKYLTILNTKPITPTLYEGVDFKNEKPPKHFYYNEAFLHGLRQRFIRHTQTIIEIKAKKVILKETRVCRLVWIGEMLTYPGDTSATFHSHKRRANYRHPTSSKALKTPARTPINEPEQASSKPHLIYKKMCANIALDYYNHKNGTRFELVEDETLDSYAFVDSSESWTHCCFNAKDDSSINNFFAELQYFYPSGPSVTTCKILTPGETQVGCGNCKSVTHPIVGYRGGSLGNVSHASYAMSDDQEEYSPATTIGYPFPVTTKPFVPEPLTFHLAPTLDIVAWVQKLRIQGEKFANRALDHYNKTNGTKFAFVNDDSTKWSPFSETWIHISFNAIDSSVVKLFFAEIKYDKFSEPAVTVCKILEGEIQGGCKNCLGKPVKHPVVGYRGDLLVETKVDKKDNDACYKVYCEEFLGKTNVG